MMGIVMEELDFIKDITLFSDKFSTREIQKMNDDFKKDMKKGKGPSKVTIWKYIKDSTAIDEEEKDDAKGSGKSTMA